MVEHVRERVAAIRNRIAEAARRSGRTGDEVTLLAVSKTHPVEAMKKLLDGPVDGFGENRVQEALTKRPLWPDGGGLPWHMIGHLQRNKARKALDVFDRVDSLDGVDLARTLERLLQETDRVLPVLIEVNCSGEDAKSGVSPAEAEALLEAVVGDCPHLAVEGLMTIGPLGGREGEVRGAFALLRELRERLRSSFALALPVLSMGMSGDYVWAVEEGSTMVRIGTALFGQRSYD
jgi:pyridoxal phosphate enzyme (YggS family)